MKLKAYNDIYNGEIIFEMEFKTGSPISDFLINHNIKETPEHYYDNSLEGLKLRLETATTEEDIANFFSFFKSNSIFDKEGNDVSETYEALMTFLETSKNNPTAVTIEAFMDFKNSNIPFFENIYENVISEYEEELKKVKSIEFKL